MTPLGPLLQFEVGDGRLIRHGNAAVFISERDRAQGFIDTILNAVPGTVLQVVQDRILECDFDTSALVGIEWTDSEVVIMLFGDISVATSARTAPTLSAAGAGTWIEHRTAVSNGVSIASADAAPLVDTQLSGGVVPAGGFALVLEPAGHTAIRSDRPERAKPVTRAAPSHDQGQTEAGSVPMDQAAGNVVEQVGDVGDSWMQTDDVAGGIAEGGSGDRIVDLFEDALPAATVSPFARPPSTPDLIEPSRDHAAVASQEVSVLVDGCRCESCGLVNRPTLTNCARCGSLDLAPVQAHPRPVVCRLGLPDGSIFAVTSRVVLGRDPEVADGSAAVSIDDPEGLVSGTHAAIEIDGWDVRVIDLESSNGTQIRTAFSTTEVELGTPYLLSVGDEIELGSVWVTVLSATEKGESQ